MTQHQWKRTKQRPRGGGKVTLATITMTAEDKMRLDQLRVAWGENGNRPLTRSLAISEAIRRCLRYVTVPQAAPGQAEVASLSAAGGPSA